MEIMGDAIVGMSVGRGEMMNMGASISIIVGTVDIMGVRKGSLMMSFIFKGG